ncbi:hypothetical protein ACJX0J_041383 [Zea mays]
MELKVQSWFSKTNAPCSIQSKHAHMQIEYHGPLEVTNIHFYSFHTGIIRENSYAAIIHSLGILPLPTLWKNNELICQYDSSQSYESYQTTIILGKTDNYLLYRVNKFFDNNAWWGTRGQGMCQED